MRPASTYKQMARGQRPVKTATPRQCTVFFSVIELETNKLKGDKEGPVPTPRNYFVLFLSISVLSFLIYIYIYNIT